MQYRYGWQCLILASVALQSSSTQAQTPSPLPEWQYSAGQPLRVYAQWGKLPIWEANIGPSANFQPKYDGSSNYHLRPGLTLDIRYSDVAFLSDGEGLGYNILRGKNHRAGLAITYDLGRHERDDSNLRGMDSLRPAPELKAFAEYLFFPVTVRGDIRHGFGGYNGWIGDFSVYLPVAGSEKYKYFVFFGPSITVADQDYLQAYFGVTPEQSVRSGYPVYRTGGGLKEVSLGVNATWFFYKQYFVNFTSGGNRYLDNAAHSPLTHEKLQGVADLSLGYDFRTETTD
jgi:outer membrane scaffolding protein for murein synthesis (MipA/OmpV family)